MKTDEMEIVRALSVKLNEDTVFTLTYQYHTEKDEMDPAGKKNDRSKSCYRMLGRVMKIKDMEAEVMRLHQPENRLGAWKWPDDPDWKGSILYAKDASNEGQSNWLRNKVKKAVSWEEGLRIMAGYKKDVRLANELKKKGKRADPEEIYSVFTPNAVYDVKEYSCSDGSVIDVTDKEALLDKVGQNVWKEIKMKLVGPKEGA